MSNQFEWSKRAELRSWLSSCRLNALADVLQQVRPDDADKRALLEQLRKRAGAAEENLRRLAQA